FDQSFPDGGPNPFRSRAVYRFSNGFPARGGYPAEKLTCGLRRSLPGGGPAQWRRIGRCWGRTRGDWGIRRDRLPLLGGFSAEIEKEGNPQTDDRQTYRRPARVLP